MTLTEFMYKTVIRNGDTAELIFGNYEDDENKPVRLMGFQTESWKTDYQIREEGFFYFLDLQDASDRMKQERGEI